MDIVDTSSTLNGQEREIFELIRLQHADLGSAGAIIFSAHPEQFAEFKYEVFDRSQTEVSTAQWILAKSREFAASAAMGDEVQEVRVFTFADSIADDLRQIEAQNSNTRFTLISLRDVLRARSKILEPITTWPDVIISKEETLSALTLGLDRAGGSIKQTNLRALLAGADKRLRKDPFRGSAVDRPQFMSMVISLAVERGLVDIDKQEPSNYLIRLAGRHAARDGTPNRAVRTPLPPPGLPASQATAPALNFDRRSDLFLHTLKGGRFGPFQEVRVALYDMVDAVIGGQGAEPISVQDVLFSSVERLRDAVESGTLDLLKNASRGYPWSALRNFLMVLMTRQAVLISTDGPVMATYESLLAKVVGMVEDWRLLLDSELIYYLVVQGCRLSVFDEEDLAGALYNSRRPASVKMVQSCFAQLEASARCNIDADLQIVLTR